MGLFLSSGTVFMDTNKMCTCYMIIFEHSVNGLGIRFMKFVFTVWYERICQIDTMYINMIERHYNDLSLWWDCLLNVTIDSVGLFLKTQFFFLLFIIEFLKKHA